MASIQRLALRGVRSFSPTDEEQCLDFLFPATFIVGMNGCGKTTIIESIKYAITGTLPPGGAKAGQSFLHDPKAIGSQLVKAQVKLRFTSRNGQVMVVVRSMELSQKKTTATFRQLDGTLRSHDEATNQRVTLSHKCSELDKQIPSLLGISKSILDYVLFCHQEDASWPLMEGSVLKKRFDDIFDSTRYTKAIEIFRKSEKEMNAKVKDLKIELAGYKSHQHAAHGFRKDLNESTEQVEELDEDKARIDQAMAALDEQIQAHANVAEHASAVEAELDARRQQKQNQLTLVNRYRSMVDEDLTGQHSLRELEKMLREYDDKVSNQREELESLQERDLAINQSIKSFRQKELEMTQEKARLDADREGYEKNCRERLVMMESLAQTYNVNFTQENGVDLSMDASYAASQATLMAGGGTQDSTALAVTDQDMRDFMKELDKKEAELRGLLQKTQDRHQGDEDKLLKDIAELNAKRSSIENDREKLNQMRRDANQELKELSKSVDGPVRVRKSDVEDIRRRLVKLVEQRDQATSDPRREEIPTKIRRLEEKVDSITRQIDDDRIALDGLRLCADAEHQISMLREQCTKDAETLEETIRENSFTFQKFNLQATEGLPSYNDDSGRQLVTCVQGIVDKVQAEYDKAKTAHSKAEDASQRAQRVVSEKSAVVATKNQSLQSMRSRLEALSAPGGGVAKVDKVIESLRKYEAPLGLQSPKRGSNPREVLAYLENRLDEIDADAPLVNEEYSRKLLKKLKKMAKMKNKDGNRDFNCPCCLRDMNQNNYEQFSGVMDEYMQNPNATFASKEKEAEYVENKAKYDDWKKVVYESSDDVREHQRLQKECASAETALQELRDEISSHQESLSKQKSELTERRDEMDELREFFDSCKRWVEDAHRIKEKRMQIDQKNDELSLSTAVSGRDLRSVEKELTARTAKKEEHVNEINRLNKEMSELNNRMATLATQTSNMEGVLREKETKLAESEKASERKNELHERLKKAKEDEEQLQEQLVPLARRIDTKTREKERLRNVKEGEIKQYQTSLLDFQSEVKELRRLTTAVASFRASGKLQLLEDHVEKAATVLRKIQAQQKEKSDLEPQLATASASVENQERYKKLLRDNIALVNEEGKISEISDSIEKLQEEFDGIEGADDAVEKHHEAQALKQKMLGEKARLEGRWMEVVEKVRSMKRKLSADEYKNVDEQHRVASIKHDTTQLASADLKKYYTAVDKALLQYHSVKITEINKIIRELWLLTYKGEDIQNIQIVSGQATGSSARRTYDYRVVMTKAGIEIDMRGRCSAGQRVLACIVIRLALAETFGVNCGCIALDEPTVNLDYKNKKGLAIALAQIISSRSKQSNFQLIMITHDEDFVSTMKTELAALSNFSMPEKFFRVHREMASDGKFYSKISATDWEDI